MSFKFISQDYTGFTAKDAPTKDDFDVSGVFIDSYKDIEFIIGNVDDVSHDYSILATGVNTEILDNITFSVDRKETFSTIATCSGIQANSVGPVVTCRFEPQFGDYLGVGTFLIRVDEV